MKHCGLLFLLIFVNTGCYGSDWNIRCRYANDRTDVFWTGEIIKGAVEFTNTDHASLVLERINAELIGEYIQKERTRVDDTYMDEESQTRFFSQRILVHPIGTMGKFPVPYGSHSWPFQLRLDESLPPTFDLFKHDGPLIQYFIRITFVRGEWYKHNTRQICPIVVKRSSDLKPFKIANEVTSRKKSVRMSITLNNDLVVAGNDVSFTLHLSNPKRNFVRRVSMIFSRTLQMPTQSNIYDALIRNNLEKTERFSGAELNETYQITVPSTAIPTFSFRLPGNLSNYPLATIYELKFETHLRGFFTNVDLTFPITVVDPMPETDDEE